MLRKYRAPAKTGILPRDDATKLMGAYMVLGETIKGIKPADFVNNIEWQVYTDWCFENPWINHHNNYDSNTLTSFIDDETHYLLVNKFKKYEVVLNFRMLLTICTGTQETRF